MNSNNIKDNDTSSQNSYNIENNSSNCLLQSNSINVNKTKDNNLDVIDENSNLQTANKDLKKSFTQTSIGSYGKPNSVVSATEEISLSYNSDPEYINMLNNKKYNPLSHSNLLNLSHKNDDTSRSNILKNYCYDICIPINKKGGSKNVEDFYEIDYEKFQEFCDKSINTNPIPKENKEKSEGTLRKRRSSFSSNASNNENKFLDNNSDNIMSSERIIFYCRENGENNHIQRVNSFQELKKVGKNSISETMKNTFFWFDILNPTKQEITVLSDVFGIHPLTVEDIEFDDTREKIETFLNYYFLSVSSFEQNSYSYIQPISVSILVFKNCVLSFHNRPTPHPDNILKRIIQLSLYDFQVNGDWLAYAHIDDIADSFMPYLRTIEIDVDSIDELVLILKESEQNDMLRRIGLARKHVTSLLRLLTDKADIIKFFIKRLNTLSPKSETLLYLSDVQDHVITMVQNLSHYDKTLTRAHSNYLAQITIEITLTANRTNDIVMKMTALGSIFLPLNVITGMWGMNVTVPGQSSDTYTSFLPFILIAITMILVSLSVLIFSRKMGML
ncbi:cora-domain-containing protein [Neocallimastix lanati (nom. inval.)]|jgi:magnesium transporter|nr:cora-domain-containing protein [Neocallimastix sp. JGI-2020a]